MSNEKHLYLTLNGGYTTPTLAAESWQVGLRCAMVFGEIDPIGTLPNNWEPVNETVARTETHWRIDGNWSIDGPALATMDVAAWMNDQVEPAAAAWMGQSSISNNVRLDSINVYPIGPDGKAVPAVPFAVGTPITLTYTSSNPTGGASGSSPLPPQLSVVTSHRTGQIGRKGRGRMFIPGPATGTMVNSVIASSAVSGFLAAQVAFLEGVMIGTLTPDNPHVRPAIIGAPWTQYALITSVDVGNVFDTQRRRRAQLLEARTSAAVTI